MRSRSLSALTLGLVISGTAVAAPSKRVQVDQHGDFLIIGNPLGLECAAGTPAPVVGSVDANACSQTTNTSDSSPDLHWRSDDPAVGQARTGVGITSAQARSAAQLILPASGHVTHAFLYWAATTTTPGADTSVTLSRTGGFSTEVIAAQSFLSVNNSYQSVADITALIQEHGAGAYTVSDVLTVDLPNLNNSNSFGGWAMVVLYERASDPLRNLGVFDGFDAVGNGAPASLTLDGFLVPTSGYTGKLGLVTYEGDNTLAGDQIFFNGGAALSDAQNPAANFFNGTRSNLGAPVSTVGDLPQLTGTAQSMAGMDLDIVDVTAKLTPGQTSVPVQATSSGDTYYLGAFVTSVSTFRPSFASTLKSVLDVNRGTAIPGDTLRYTIVVANDGNDGSVNTKLMDTLPVGATYVPGSLSITSGPNQGGLTDQAGDDVGEYDVASQTLTVRLGAGATAETGGSVGAGATTTVQFDVTIDAGVLGWLSNRATVSAAGLLGAPATTVPTDGSAEEQGSTPTLIYVDVCGTNADCPNASVCDTSVLPHACVGCLSDADCGLDVGSVCDLDTQTCFAGCRSGAGCPAPLLCTSTTSDVGACVGCVTDADCGDATSGKLCDVDQTCVDGCRALDGNGCPAGKVCTSTDATSGRCVGCLSDADCGDATSGKVCDVDQTCTPGCRAEGGNGCPSGQICTSTGPDAGSCDPVANTGGTTGSGGTDSGGTDSGGTDSGGTSSGGKPPTGGMGPGGQDGTESGGSENGASGGSPTGGLGGAFEDSNTDGTADSGGCSCSTTRGSDTQGMATLLALFGGVLFVERRRRRAGLATR
jgi:uncharacterized repeat protein (TIGR01451 family)/MYXO-CTERM domain-containing protein